jgi:NDP-sugar pyrophosphorylase family protein
MKKRSSTPALVLAGGIGSRLRPLTLTTPKCLVPILGVPLLEYWMQELRRSDVTRVVVNTHHLPDPVRAYLGEVSARLGIDAREFHEPELLGSAGTVAANRDLCGEADCCVLIYADNLSTVRIDELIAFHRSHDEPMTMMLFRTAHPKACGIATLDETDRIVEFVEKPEHPKSDLANGGVYVVSREAYLEMADLGAFDLGFDVLPRFVGRMKGFAHGGLHIDIGTLDALEQAQGLARDHFGPRPFSEGPGAYPLDARGPEAP